MKIKSIHLNRFRQFQDTTFEVGSFNLLVGPNNCGKTSVLHAIRSFFKLMSGHIVFEGTPPQATYHRRFLSSAEEVAPTPDIRELWYEQQTGKPLRITLTFEDEIAFSVVLRQQFGQIHVSTETLPKGLTTAKVAAYLDIPIAFIPGLVGVLVNEPYATTARRNSLAIEGRYSEIFRSSLQQLKAKQPDLLETINSWLSGLFDVTVSRVDFDQEADEFVTVKYRQGRKEYDVVSSGAGLQQVIQMLTYLYLSAPKILLIDEPDAHLHSHLQARLGELFRRVAADLQAQVFLSTHSLDLIDTFSTDDVIVIDSSRKILSVLGTDTDLVGALVDAGVVDVSALSRLLASHRLVVIEDQDQSMLKAIDKALGSPLFSPAGGAYVLPAKGVGNFRALAELGKVLSQLVGRDFDLRFLQDRDGLPHFLVKSLAKAQRAEGVEAKLLGRHEIESYLVEPKLLVRAAKREGKTLKAATVEKAIRDAAQGLRAKARRNSLETAKRVNRVLQRGDKFKDTELEEKVYEWFDGLDVQDCGTVQSVFPGKELLKETLKLLGKTVKLTRGKVVAAVSRDTIAADLRQTIEELAGAKDKG